MSLELDYFNQKTLTMKKLSILIFILFSAFSMNAQHSISGIWNTGKGNTKIEIKEVNGIFEGKIASSDNSNAKIGTLLLKEIESVSEEGEWIGKLYAAKKGKWITAVLTEKGNRLLITIKVGQMVKKLEWSKE